MSINLNVIFIAGFFPVSFHLVVMQSDKELKMKSNILTHNTLTLIYMKICQKVMHCRLSQKEIQANRPSQYFIFIHHLRPFIVP